MVISDEIKIVRRKLKTLKFRIINFVKTKTVGIENYCWQHNKKENNPNLWKTLLAHLKRKQLGKTPSDSVLHSKHKQQHKRM